MRATTERARRGMPTGERIRRMATACMMVLQLALAFLAPLADARREADGARVTAHLESDSEATCPAPHDHDHCLLCRSIHGGFEASSPSESAALTSGHDRALVRATSPSGGTTRTLPPTRAPPAVRHVA